jgi:hypothetical protein
MPVNKQNGLFFFGGGGRGGGGDDTLKDGPELNSLKKDLQSRLD